MRDGRRREFAHFKSFAEMHGERQIPDPTSEETFALACLRWDEAAREPHAATRAEIGRLLHLRRDEIVPLLKTPFLGADRALRGDCLEVTWRFGGGTLRFVGNFGSDPAAIDAGDGARVIWASPSAEGRDGGLGLPTWTGAFLKSASP